MPLLEKAWAKLCGTYARTSGGLSGVAADHILGVTSDTIWHDDCMYDIDRTWSKFKEAGRRKFVIMAGTRGGGERGNASGIYGGHAYTILSAHETQGKKILRIRNPWGSGEWKGDYSDDSPLWTPSLKNELGWVKKDDGIFFMPFKDYMSQFRMTWICVDDDILGKD